MTIASTPKWERMRTEESRAVEAALHQAGFTHADAYRYNSASLRVRVIDPRFEGMPVEDRDALVEQSLEKLPERTQADIVTLLTLAPSETKFSPEVRREFFLNTEFDDPSPSML